MAGSVYKQCTKCTVRVKQRTCGRCGRSRFTWGFTVDVGKDTDGRRIQQKRTGFLIKADAERALHEVQTSLHRGTFVPRSSITLGEYLRDEWLPATRPPRVKYETWDDRRRNLEVYVIPRIGGVLLQELNAAHLNRLYTELLTSGRIQQEGGLSVGSVRRIHAMLSKALRDAIRWGRLAHSPAELADPPSMKVVQASRRRSMRTWTGDELRRFLAATEPHALYPMWFFASSTGVRRSEMVGQRTPDLNLLAATVTVRHTVTPSENGYQHTDDQKSQRSARTVHLDRRTVEVLRAHLDTQEEIRRQVGPRWNPHGLLFPRPDGTWWNPPAVSESFKRAVKAAGVPQIRLHDLRHTHASLLLAAGVNPKVVSERLGHSSVAFTLDTYAHIMPGMQPDAAEQFMDLVFNGEHGDQDLDESTTDEPDETPEDDR